MRSGWKRLVQLVAAGTLAVGLWAQGSGAAEVKNVTAEYAWPWGAEIRYEVVGTFFADPPPVVTVTDRMSGATYVASANALSGDTGGNSGIHRLIWDLDKQGVKLQSTNVVFSVMYEPLYCVVDLSAAANAASYPVTYMDAPPSGGFNTDVYKTTKLVLRRIEAGTFKMGENTQTTLSKPYYIGLFEVTQKQWQLVTGNNPSKNFLGDKRPVQWVSWNTIRGNTNWPASSAVSVDSFMGRLRARTGLAFDLPTEAQWEYACRAGTTTAFSYGENANGDYMWYEDNSSSATHDVGTKKQNPWGLYDMHGNVYEFCLDWYGSLSGGIDPKGSSSGSRRVTRGGGFDNSARYCASSFRNYDGGPACAFYSPGFRLVKTVSK